MTDAKLHILQHSLGAEGFGLGRQGRSEIRAVNPNRPRKDAALRNLALYDCQDSIVVSGHDALRVRGMAACDPRQIRPAHHDGALANARLEREVEVFVVVHGEYPGSTRLRSRGPALSQDAGGSDRAIARRIVASETDRMAT